MWSQIVCREVVRGCMAGMLSNDKMEKKFVIALLYGKNFKMDKMSLYRYMSMSNYSEDNEGNSMGRRYWKTLYKMGLLMNQWLFLLYSLTLIK